MGKAPKISEHLKRAAARAREGLAAKRTSLINAFQSRSTSPGPSSSHSTSPALSGLPDNDLGCSATVGLTLDNPICIDEADDDGPSLQPLNSQHREAEKSPEGLNGANTAAGEKELDSESILEICSWDGTVNHNVNNCDSDLEADWCDVDDKGDGSDSDDEVVELEGQELVKSLGEKLNAELDALEKMSLYQQVNRKISAKEWVKAESNRALGYTGHSKKTQQRHAREARSKEVIDAKLRKS